MEHRTDDDDAPVEPREALALLQSEQTRTQRALEPDVRLLYGTWGAAWLVGFLLLWQASTGRGPVVLPQPGAGIAFTLCMVVAVVVTGVHIARRTGGVRGVSSTTGAMYGWAWFLGFCVLGAVMAATARAGAPEQVLAILGPVLSGLVVGLLYLAGGALWQDRAQYSLGVWILLASAAGALAGFPGNYLVMGLAGGGGFLVAAAVVAVAARGRST